MVIRNMPDNPTAADFTRVLQPWAKFARTYWWDDPARPDLGCFGSGYDSWGVQTNQKFVGAFGVLAADPGLDEAKAGVSREEIVDRCLKALRFSIESHITGSHHCADGRKWGHTWISVLGVERMMHGVEAIQPHLTQADLEGLRRMLVSEADGILKLPVQGTLWASEGGNKPESNIWNGALLARVCRMYPDEPRVADWTEKSNQFLLNGISVEADALVDHVISGKPLRDWHVGPNFFENYALDHHGYLNVGYMVICLSNIAMLHFACRTNGWDPPEGLYHHAEDLWRLVKRLVFADGRLCRIGGDTRTRYCYCQDYLLPALLWCADYLNDGHAPELEAGALELIRAEQAASVEQSFLSPRLATIREDSPYYYTRLEADKAVVLSMNAYWRRVLDIAPTKPAQAFEESVAGSWQEPEHGAILHRAPRRIASWSWRASEPPQGLCLPPESGHYAEWCANMGGHVRLLGDSGRRSVSENRQAQFSGGFITTGTMTDSVKAVLPEGWTSPEKARHHYAVAALPDDCTMVVMEYCSLGIRTYLSQVKGLKLNVPNDLFNGFRRVYQTAKGPLETQGDGRAVIRTGSRWLNLDGRIGCVGIYGAEEFTVFQAGRRRASGYGDSLYYEELCFPCRAEPHNVNPGAVVLDCASAVVSGVDAQYTADVSGGVRGIQCEERLGRACIVPGADGRDYLLVTSFGEDATVTLRGLPRTEPWTDLVSGRQLPAPDGCMTVELSDLGAALFSAPDPSEKQ